MRDVIDERCQMVRVMHHSCEMSLRMTVEMVPTGLDRFTHDSNYVLVLHDLGKDFKSLNETARDMPLCFCRWSDYENCMPGKRSEQAGVHHHDSGRNLGETGSITFETAGRDGKHAASEGESSSCDEGFRGAFPIACHSRALMIGEREEREIQAAVTQALERIFRCLCLEQS